MLSRKHYANRIDNPQGNTFFSRLFEIGFFVLLVGYFIFHNKRIPMIICTAFGLVCGLVFMLNKAKNHKIKIPSYTVWYFLFFVYAEFSSFWAMNPNISVRMYLVIMILMLLISLFVPQYTDTVSQAETILKIFIFSTLFISLIQLVYTPIDSWFSGFFGSAVGNNNTNHYGFLVMASAIISFYFAYSKSEKNYYWLVLVFFLFCVLSSSRKSILFALFGIICIILFSFKKRFHILHFAIIATLATLSILLIMEVEVLYNVAGVRFTSLIEHYIYGENSDGSLSMREYFIDFAKLLFEEKPILGHGFANFAKIFSTQSDSSWSVYAHNNYWEILADLGIVGFIIYYWYYLFLLIKLVVKIIKERDNPLPILGLSLLISEIILEWGVVSMTTFQPQVVLILISICSLVSNSNRRYHYISGANQR